MIKNRIILWLEVLVLAVNGYSPIVIGDYNSASIGADCSTLGTAMDAY